MILVSPSSEGREGFFWFGVGVVDVAWAHPQQPERERGRMGGWAGGHTLEGKGEEGEQLLNSDRFRQTSPRRRRGRASYFSLSLSLSLCLSVSLSLVFSLPLFFPRLSLVPFICHFRPSPPSPILLLSLSLIHSIKLILVLFLISLTQNRVFLRIVCSFFYKKVCVYRQSENDETALHSLEHEHCK